MKQNYSENGERENGERRDIYESALISGCLEAEKWTRLEGVLS